MAMWLCGYVDQFQKFKFLNFKDPKSWVHTWSKIFDFVGSQISKDNIFQDVPISFLIFLKYVGIIKAINTASTGPDLAMNRSKI